MVKDFDWPDDDEVPCEGNQPEEAVAVSLLECGTVISNFALKSMNVKQFDNNYQSSEVNPCVDIPIPTDIHELLQSRLDEKWDTESRMKVFEAVQTITNAMMGCMITDFSKKISDILSIDANTVCIERMELLDSIFEIEGQESQFHVQINFRTT